MTLIGISQRSLPPNEFGERRYALDVRWFPLLHACGLTPVPLPNDPRLALHTARAAGLRGLLLTGGDDLAEYGGPTPERDRTEQALLAWAVDRDLPVLGVCRGTQIILRSYGAELVPVDGHVATRHAIRTEGGAIRTVNSYHRMAALAAPPPLLATATCDGTVEAVRHRHARVEGIMWHPEREAEPDPLDLRTLRRVLGGERT
ncbi:gamma-glutamyl-gamma-aminobutyrate hydrolase family protein [Streptomyces sp. NPDC059788]|uniref:gamma-glutamyl-gamma-aminobutyrate hydrolase family protein n=1 Tax=Streptomyces sp. NPDC059788 TaxID=3346948 RepID=UPI003652C3DF